MVSPIRGYDRVENFDTFNVGSGFVRVFWTPWMRGTDRGERGLATGPHFVEIGRVDTAMGMYLTCRGGRGPFLLYKCSSEAGGGGVEWACG